MDTRSMLEKLLKTTRKPAEWSEVGTADFSLLPKKVQERLMGLRTADLGPNPWDSLPPLDEREGLGIRLDEVYYFNTEGYDYPRYLTRLANFPKGVEDG